MTVRMGDDRLDAYSGLELGAAHPRSISRVLQAEQPTDDLGLIWLDTSVKPPATPATGGALLGALLGLADWTFLSGAAEGLARLLRR